MPESLATLPEPAALEPLRRLSVSEAPFAQRCALRVVYSRDKHLEPCLPTSAAQLIGTAVHLTFQSLEASFREAAEPTEDTSTIAASAFDSWLELLCQEHSDSLQERVRQLADSPVVPRELPYYRLQRARLARRAVERYGPRWKGSPPRAERRTPRSGDRQDLTAFSSGVLTEVRLRSRCGRLSGIADRVEGGADGIRITELKTGQLDERGLEAAVLQVRLYGFLLYDESGQWPDHLVVRSLSGDELAIPAQPEDLREEAEGVFEVLGRIDATLARLSSAAAAQALSRIGAGTCPTCPHRPWCQPYWADGARFAGESRADVEGIVDSVRGGLVELRTCQPMKSQVLIDFSRLGLLPESGEKLRICSAYVPPTGPLRLDHRTTVWTTEVPS